MSKVNWFTVIAILIFLGAIATSVEIWVGGGAEYTSTSRRGGVAEWVIRGMTSLIGSKATAIVNFVVLGGVAYLVYKLGQLRRRM